MQPTTEILERISKDSLTHKEEVFTRLYRYLLRPDIYYQAYQRLYTNKGASTKGTPEDVDEAVPRTRRTVNREKVTDHHAILPTRSMLQADLDALPKGEQNVLKLIIARTLMAVSKPFRYLETLLTTECAGEEFTAKGKEILEEGWKAVERKVLADILNRKQELTALPNAAENECGILNAELKEGQTSPPKHFTEDLLLHAMETASADSMPEGVERQGIGTPATRAATIEKLVQKGFLERKGNKKTKVLLPTDSRGRRVPAAPAVHSHCRRRRSTTPRRTDHR